MADLEPRSEHAKPKKTDLARSGILRQVAHKILPTRGARMPSVDLRPSVASPIGVLVDGSITVKFREGSGVRVDAARGSIVRAHKDADRAARLGRLGLRDEVVGRDIDDLNKLLRDLPASDGPRMEAAFARDGAKLDAEQHELEKSIGAELADLGLYHVISMPKAGVADLERTIDALNAHDLVEIAYATPIPYLASPDIAPTTAAFTGQGYLDAAPGGIDARYAWTKRGGRGDGVRIIDVEFAWHKDHEDLPGLFFDGSGLNLAISTYAEHGTAVLGILGAQENAYGFTGIAPRASLGVCTWFSIWGIAHAIDDAASNLRRGDVLLIEIHYPGPTSNLFDAIQNIQTGFVPVEYFPASFDAIRRATARGVIVVAAAGNGSTDLDAPLYERRFDRSVRDSGSILVGAGTPNAGMPEWFTNHGSRVDVHGWGSGVATLGYGDLQVPGAEGDVRQWYTRRFSGTSSATPIVGGAVAAIQGALMQIGQEPLGPTEMRNLLRDTGTPQAPDARQIGKLPNLRDALDRVLPPPPPAPTWPSLGGIIVSQPAVGRNLDQRLEVFAIGTDGMLWHLSQTAPNAGFSGWSTMGTAGVRPGVRFVGRPAVANAADGRLEVFVRGDDNHIWHIYQTAPNGGFSNWDDLGGNAASDPCVGVNDNGRLEVFFRGADATLQHNWQMWPNGGWHTFGWQSLGGNLQGAPAVVRNADTRLQVFVRGTGNAIQTIAQRTPGGAWGAWTHMGGEFSADPEAILSATSLGVVWQVFVRGMDGRVWVFWQTAPNGGFTGPSPFDGSLPPSGRVALRQKRDGGAAVIARFADGSIQERRQHPTSGGWTSWTQTGTNVASDPAVGLHADGRLEVFAMGSDRSLVHRRDP